jgi:hypothetical protein
MKKTVESEFISLKNTMKHFLPKGIVADLEKIITNNKTLDPELWAEIVYNFAAAWKNVESESDRYRLLDSFKTLWIGRFVSYATEVKDMDINEAEIVIQKQAEIFEGKIDYLRSIYENSIMPS